MIESLKPFSGKGAKPEMPVTYLRKKLSPYVRVATIVVLAALAIFAGARVYSWNSAGIRPRLLTLVNAWNPVSETGYSARLTEAENGLQIDRVCAEPLKRMLADCRTAGKNAVLSYAYRSVNYCCCCSVSKSCLIFATP